MEGKADAELTGSESVINSFKPLTANPLVSILMPAFNEENFIKRAIESTIAQTYSNWELLVLDDASTDETNKIIRTFSDSRIRVFEHEKNLGYLDSCNELFTSANGELITFLDADDLQSADRIEVCVNAFKQDDELGFVTTDNARIDSDDDVLGIKSVVVDYFKMANDPSYEVYFACASLMMRREVHLTVGGYHPFFGGIGGEDYHMIWELSRIAIGKHIAKPLYLYRKHPEQNQFLMKDPLKYLMMDILLDIRKQVLADNNDPLRTWPEYKQIWYKHAEQSSVVIEFSQALEKLQQGHKAQCLFQSILTVLKNPLSKQRWDFFTRLIIRTLVSIRTNG